MRAALLLAIAGLLIGGLLMPDPGSGASARAKAYALIAGGTPGPHGDVAASGNGEQRRSGGVEAPGISVSSGDAVARTSVGGGAPMARATAAARTVSLLDGVVTAYGVRRTVEVQGEQQTVSGRVEGLRIGDRVIGDVDAAQDYRLPDDSGRVIVNRGTIGLRVRLERASGKYPAGTDIRVAVAGASTSLPRPQATPDASATPDSAAARARKKARRDRAKRDKAGKGLERRAAPAVRRRLTAGGFAFPVYGEASVADDFGGPRQIGPHQGNDIFADFGAPVVAVADGVVSKVGTLEISGNRLWVTSESGDAFFYAHLSAFSPAAVDGARVKAGTVLGFVGNTGDAEPTPPHVHFEIHPGGEDEDAIDPHQILLAWQGRRDVPPGAWLQRYGPDTAERPGALVAVRDFIAE